MWSLYIFVFYRPALSIFDILLSLSYYWCVWLKIRCHVFHYRLNRVFEDKLSKVVGNEFQEPLSFGGKLNVEFQKFQVPPRKMVSCGKSP